jgi:hypothetical protein
MNIIVLDQFCIAQRIINASMHQCAIWLVSPSVTLCRPNYIFEWLTDCKCRRNRIGIYAFRAESKSRNKLFPYIYEMNLQSSGIWCHVDWEIVADVSEELTLSICMFCAFLDCMSQKTWSYMNSTVRGFKFMLAFELSRFWTLDLFTYMFLVMSVPCISFILSRV